MMNNRLISEKRQKLIDEKNASKLQEGERIYVSYNAVNDYKSSGIKSPIICIILELGEKIKVRYSDNSTHKKTYLITSDDIVGRYLLMLGSNPFDEKSDHVRPVAFILSSIIHSLDIFGDESRSDKYSINGINVNRCNWNPFVYNKKGEKEYYQRPFVWSLQDKQLLIESIYQGVDCGRVLVRKRGYEELTKMQANGETELASSDIVDGKQRLEAIRGFVMLEYADANGDYYNDLSFRSQHNFMGHQLFSYAEMAENTPDEDVVHQFLKLNFCGVPQSKEHIEFIKSLQNKM